MSARTQEPLPLLLILAVFTGYYSIGDSRSCGLCAAAVLLFGAAVLLPFLHVVRCTYGIVCTSMYILLLVHIHVIYFTFS